MKKGCVNTDTAFFISFANLIALLNNRHLVNQMFATT